MRQVFCGNHQSTFSFCLDIYSAIWDLTLEPDIVHISNQVRNSALAIVARRISWKKLTAMETIDSKYLLHTGKKLPAFLTNGFNRTG